MEKPYLVTNKKKMTLNNLIKIANIYKSASILAGHLDPKN